MGLFVFPLKSINGSNTYNNDDFRQYFANFIATGILANAPITDSTALQVVQTSTPSMNINVGIGVAWLGGGQVMNDTPKSFQIPAPLTTQSRTDSIVVKWSSTENNGDIVYKQNSTQVIQTEDVYELQLAVITVLKNATSISQANITDTRADPKVCGFSSPFESIKTGDLLAQFKAELEANGTTFTTWFDSVKGQLSTDAAGHLQNQINDEVVHNTNDETIAGKKTFTDDIRVTNLEVTGTLTSASLSVPYTGSPILTDGNVELSRVGDMVYCKILSDYKNKVPENFYDLVLKEIPTGYKPRATEVFPVLSYNIGTSTGNTFRGSAIFNNSNTGGIRITHPLTENKDSGVFINAYWFTDEAYPTTN